MSKADGNKKYYKKYIWIFLVLFLLVALAVVFLTGRDQVQEEINVGSIICERIKEEIPIREFKISNDGEGFFLEAGIGKEDVLIFFEKKLGEMGKKLRVAQTFLPEELKLSCYITLKKEEKWGGVRPVITYMSLNDYEIPSAFLENIVDFPLILKDFYSIIDS